MPLKWFKIFDKVLLTPMEDEALFGWKSWGVGIR